MPEAKLVGCDNPNHPFKLHQQTDSCLRPRGVNWREQPAPAEPRTSLTDWENLRPDGTRHREPKLERAELLAELAKLREERDALVDLNNRLAKLNVQQTIGKERAESALASAREKALGKQINDDWTCWCEVCCIVRRGLEDKRTEEK